MHINETNRKELTNKINDQLVELQTTLMTILNSPVMPELSDYAGSDAYELFQATIKFACTNRSYIESLKNDDELTTLADHLAKAAN